MSFMPAVLAGVILAFNGKRLAGAVLTAVALAMELYTGHIQITYYLFMVLGVYGIAQLIVAINKKHLVLFQNSNYASCRCHAGIGTNITSLWLTYEYSKYSTRGKSELTLHHENKSSGLTQEYATQWSYGVGESMTLLIPNFKGGCI